MRISFKKRAFTITEALVSFALIGLIFVATITNIGRNDHYDKLYWQAFNTLYQASKSAFDKFQNTQSADENKKKWYKNNGENRYDKYGDSREATPNIQRKYPGFLKEIDEYNDKSGNTFCERLTEFINTSDPKKDRKGGKGTECDNLILGPNFTILNTRGKVGVNFYEGFSTVKKGEDGTFDVPTNVIKPSFTTLNGQKFYITQILTANFIYENDDFSFKKRESFRFVIVDLNGNTGPNTQFIKSGRYPDIVLFAIDSEGNVIPLGLPELTKKYISAVATYPTDLRSDGTPVYPAVRSPVGTLWNIKKRAWGYSTDDNSAQDKFPYMQPISQHEALSQSTKFYYNAAICIENPESCEDKNLKPDKNYVDSAYTYLVNQFLYKSEGSTEYYEELLETPEITAKNSLDDKNGCVTITNIEKAAPTCGIDFKH